MAMRQARSSGFTIIEVMIVLAVTSLLFLSASALISGRTNQTEFDQSTRALQQQIQDTINEVSSGDFSAAIGANAYTCTAGVGSITFGPGGTGQGTNQGCIFVGKVMQFGVGANQDQEITYDVAGLRQQPSGDEVTSLAQAAPAVIELGGTTPDAQTAPLEYGLHTYFGNGNVSSMSATTNLGKSPIGAFAFVYSLASYSGGSIVSGSQQINVVPVATSTLGMTQAAMVTAINSQLKNSPDFSSGTTVSICLESATTNQYAIITIGGSNDGQLGVTLSIIGARNGTTCPN
jgi:prepilin-type N-terminal cleavage/methylation domain-containing protein